MPRIAVIGDLMLDTYHYVDTVRPAPEGGLIYRINDTEHRPGAAANVADCLETLGWDVTLYGYKGPDASSRMLESWAMACNIHSRLFDCGKNIRTNTRYIHNNKCLFRVDTPTPNVQWDTFPVEELQYCDAVVLYDKGALTSIAESILHFCKTHNIKTYVDPYRVNNGYPNSYLLKANTDEVAYINPENLALSHIKEKNNWEHCILTHDIDPLEYSDATHTSHHYPITANPKFLDAIGAGDAFLATLITAHGLGKTLQTSIPHAIRAGAIAVEHRGTYAPKRGEVDL